MLSVIGFKLRSYQVGNNIVSHLKTSALIDMYFLVTRCLDRRQIESKNYKNSLANWNLIFLAGYLPWVESHRNCFVTLSLHIFTAVFRLKCVNISVYFVISPTIICLRCAIKHIANDCDGFSIDEFDNNLKFYLIHHGRLPNLPHHNTTAFSAQRSHKKNHKPILKIVAAI